MSALPRGNPYRWTTIKNRRFYLNRNIKLRDPSNHNRTITIYHKTLVQGLTSNHLPTLRRMRNQLEDRQQDLEEQRHNATEALRWVVDRHHRARIKREAENATVNYHSIRLWMEKYDRRIETLENPRIHAFEHLSKEPFDDIVSDTLTLKHTHQKINEVMGPSLPLHSYPDDEIFEYEPEDPRFLPNTESKFKKDPYDKFRDERS